MYIYNMRAHIPRPDGSPSPVAWGFPTTTVLRGTCLQLQVLDVQFVGSTWRVFRESFVIWARYAMSRV